MVVKIKRLHKDAVIPTYAHGHEEDAGMDLLAVEDVVLKPNVPTLVKTGLAIELPAGFEAQIRPRSGLALKQGITVWNSPGTIDPAYRGEIGVILLWNGLKPNLWEVPGSIQNTNYFVYGGFEKGTSELPVPQFSEFDKIRVTFRPNYTGYVYECEPRYRAIAGDRIAQMIIARYEAVSFVETELNESVRGAGGFGSSGK